MYLKLMGRVNGDHRMVEVTEYAFRQHPKPVIVYCCLSSTKPDATMVEVEVELTGTCYVQDRNGKTIETLKPR